MGALAKCERTVSAGGDSRGASRGLIPPVPLPLEELAIHATRDSDGVANGSTGGNNSGCQRECSDPGRGLRNYLDGCAPTLVLRNPD